MSDIGNILLPDINLMDRYQQSFDKQLALQKYFYQDSQDKLAQFTKENAWTPSPVIEAFGGSSKAQIDDLNNYNKLYQSAVQDRSKGGMWNLDPKVQAELTQARYKLQSNQQARLQNIAEYASAEKLIRDPRFELTHDMDYTKNWMEDVKKGVIRNDDPILARPTDTGEMIADYLKKKKSVTTDGPVIGNNKTQTKVLSDYFSNGNYDPKTYKQNVYNDIQQELMNNPAMAHSAETEFLNFAQKNRPQAEQLVKQYGQNAPAMYAFNIHQAKIDQASQPINTKIGYKPTKTGSGGLTKAEQKKILVPDQSGFIDLNGLPLTTDYTFGEDDPKTNSYKKGMVTKADVLSANTKTNKATLNITIPATQNRPSRKEVKEVPLSTVMGLLKNKGYSIQGTNNNTVSEVKPKRKLY